MSLAPRFARLVMELWRVVRSVLDVGKAARSKMRRPGLELIVPRREMRRPAWSAE